MTASSTVLSSSRILNYKHWYEIPHLLAGNRRIAITYAAAAAATPFGATLYSSLLFEMNNVNAFLAFTFGATLYAMLQFLVGQYFQMLPLIWILSLIHLHCEPLLN